jgi:hypothetical protein
MSISYRQTLHAIWGSPYLTTLKIADPDRGGYGNMQWQFNHGVMKANRMIAFIEYPKKKKVKKIKNKIIIIIIII